MNDAVETAPKKPRLHNFVRISCPPAAKALAEVLGQTVEAFIADALAVHIDAKRAEVNKALGK